MYKRLEGGASRRLLKSILETYDLFDSVLGFLDRREEPIGEILKRTVEAILEIRETLRGEGRYDLSDSIRERLEKAGVKVEDSAEGPRWRVEESPRIDA